MFPDSIFLSGKGDGTFGIPVSTDLSANPPRADTSATDHPRYPGNRALTQSVTIRFNAPDVEAWWRTSGASIAAVNAAEPGSYAEVAIPFKE